VSGRTNHLVPGDPQLTYLASGDGCETVVLLHGVGSSADTWHLLVPLLPEGLRVVAPDFRGHGGSEAPAGPYELNDFVMDLVRLLDTVELDQVHLVGFSLGAVVAEAVAVAYPERVATLVLLNSIADRLPEERERALTRLEATRTTPPDVMARASVERWFTQRFIADSPELVEQELKIFAGTEPEAYSAAYEVLATAEIIDDVAAIESPTLIMTGENDVGSTPRMSRALHSRIPESTLHIVPGLRHYMHVEAASEIAARIGEFIEQHQTIQSPKE
jgi:pimeloyl-ACP methyl ester carboxylesterase